MFFAESQCTGSYGTFETIGAFRQLKGWDWGGGIRSTEDPRLKQKWPGDFYAYTLQTVDAAFHVTPTRAFVMTGEDAFHRRLDFPYYGFGPDPYAVKLVGYGDGRVYAHRSIGTCGVVLAIPFTDFDAFRPFAVANVMLTPAVRRTADLTLTASLVAGGVVIVFLALAMVLAAKGFNDREEKDSADDRGKALSRGLLSGLALLFVLGVVIYVAVWLPRQALIDTQTYYALYDSLPRSGTVLAPIPADVMAQLAQPPPAPKDMVLNGAAVLTTFGICLLVILVVSGKRMYRGLYWLFAELPLKRCVRRARQEGRWPTAQELFAAFEEATRGKADWQMQMMARKALRLAAALDREALAMRG